VWLVATVTIALAVVPSTASAAATRADYVSQVDQICATTTKGFGRLGPRLKTLFGPKAYAPPHMQGSSSPTKKQLRRLRNRFVNRLARVLEILNQSLSSTTEQIALVTPAPGDEDAVAQWIAGLRQYVTFTASSIRSLRHHKPGNALAFQRQATQALNAGGAAVQGFGIVSCLTSLSANV
jgi:hypothetical protein